MNPLARTRILIITVIIIKMIYRSRGMKTFFTHFETHVFCIIDWMDDFFVRLTR